MVMSDALMKEAVSAFWGRLAQGSYNFGGKHEIDIFVSSKGAKGMVQDDEFVAGLYETTDITLLQLNGHSKRLHRGYTTRNTAELERAKAYLRLMNHIINEGRDTTVDIMEPPRNILDMVMCTYNPKSDKIMLTGHSDEDKREIIHHWEPDPFSIGNDGLHASWMDSDVTFLELSADPHDEYDRVFRTPIESPEVEEIEVIETKLGQVQVMIDAIEKDIRQLRAKERDFNSSSVEMARRLGKQNEYEELLKQRDEAMWRENPRGRDDNFDTILKLESYHGEQSTIDVNGPDGDYTFLLVQVRNGVVLNDETTYGYRSGDAAFKDCHVPELPCYFSEGGVSSHVRPNHRNFDLVVRLDSTHDENTSVEIETAFGATVFAIYTVTDGWVDDWQTDYGYLAEGPAIQAAGSEDKTLRIYHSMQEGAITPEAGPAVEVSESELDAVQRGIDKIEKAMDTRRKKDNDYKTSALQVAKAVGKREKYEKLLKRRDELMWRGNPGKIPEYKIAIDKFYLMQEYKGSVRQAYGRRAGLNYEVVDRTEEVTLKVHRNMIASIWIHPKSQDRILSIDAWFMSHSPLGRRIGDAILRIGEAHGHDILKPFRLGLESRKRTSTYTGKWGKKETSTWDENVVILAHDDGRYTIVTHDLPGPHAIESDGWMNPLRYTSLDLNGDPETEYKRLLWSERPIEELEVEEVPMITSDLEATQALIDAIELEIRALRSSERDFTSTDIAVAERLGKREQYEQLMKRRDEAMWRGNPIKNLSANTMKMVRAGEGFRCESYGGSGSRVPSKVVRFEYEELNNDMTDQMIEALGLPTKLTPEQVFERIKQDYDDKYDAVWLATEEEVKEHYCDGDEPEGYNIPPGAIVLQDLGNDGTLFLLPKQRENPASPFTATWPPEPSHGSPVPPRNIPTEWFDEDGRAILPEHEEEFMDLVIYKFWRGDQVLSEKVMTKGAFMGRHDKGEEGYEWTHWDGEYRLSINQYGPTDPTLPAGTLLRSIELNGVEIVFHILAPIKNGDELEKLNRLSMRTHPDLVANAGRVGWAPEEERVPLAIAIDKTHFVIRKALQQGRKYYPILNWIEIETWTKNGVEPDMELAAVVAPEGLHMQGYDTIPIPEGTFHFDRMMSDRGFYIELKSQPEPRPGSAAALEHLMFGNEINAELKRIFNVALEVDVAEMPVEPTAIADIQDRVDDIEREIRTLRAKEKDFISSNSAVAARLGKQDEYDKLMRERDEQMWRGNPGERRVVTKEDMRKRAKLPKLLYHGTSIQNMHKVLREGLLVHQPQSAYTVESQHQEDTNLNVSLANTVQDAVFFSLGAAGWGADQAIIEFDTTDMSEEEYPAILRRPLFGKTGRFEYKFYTMKGIPPERISRVLIRSFSKPAGRLEVTERWYTREEALTAFVGRPNPEQADLRITKEW